MITLTGPSALEVYATLADPEQAAESANLDALDWSSGSASDLDALEELGIPATSQSPVHLLCPSRSTRVQSRRVVNHVCSGRLPKGSLRRLGPGVLICSPELCFVQAGKDGVGYAAAVGMELCGNYGRCSSHRGFIERDPLCTPDDLAGYLADLKNISGLERARRALPLVLAGSRSPLETKTAIILTASVQLGGYALPKPICNHTVIPTSAERPLYQAPYYIIDLCWPEQKVALECDSYTHHRTHDELEHDAMKANSLTSTRWTCLQATSGQLSGDQLDVLARQLSATLGVAHKQPAASQRDRLIASLP